MCNITESKLAECQRENRELRARVERLEKVAEEARKFLDAEFKLKMVEGSAKKYVDLLEGIGQALADLDALGGGE